MVLPTPDRIEPERMNEPRLLDGLGKPLSRVITRRVLRVEIDPELHDVDGT
jgi:hypothetical protein